MCKELIGEEKSPGRKTEAQGTCSVSLLRFPHNTKYGFHAGLSSMIYRKPNDIFDFDLNLKGNFLDIYLDYINKFHLNQSYFR